MSKLQSIAGGKVYENDSFENNAISFTEANANSVTSGFAGMAPGANVVTTSTSYVNLITLNVSHPVAPNKRGLYAVELSSNGSTANGAPILNSNSPGPVRLVMDAAGPFPATELYSTLFGPISNSSLSITISAGKIGFIAFFTLEPTATLLTRTIRLEFRSINASFEARARNLGLRWWQII